MKRFLLIIAVALFVLNGCAAGGTSNRSSYESGSGGHRH